MNATLPASACPPACNACRLRRTGAFTPVQPEQLDFIQRFRADTATVPAGGAVVHENQDNARLFTLYSGWAFRYKTLSDGERPRGAPGLSPFHQSVVASSGSAGSDLAERSFLGSG